MHNQNKYYIQEHLNKKVFHGGIGNADIERILANNHFQGIIFPCIDDFSITAKIKRLFYLIRFCTSAPKGSVIVFQFPLHARMHKLLLRVIRLRKTIQVVCIVSDIDGIRDGDPGLLAADINTLRTYSLFILHNAKMALWHNRNIRTGIWAQLHFFDFLAVPSVKRRNKSFQIAIAANLVKSPYVKKLGSLFKDYSQLQFNIYGEGITESMTAQPNIHYKGTYPPETLPQTLDGAFGLVWDGDDIMEPSGPGGRYMQINSPHKLSLYILARMPVIIYEHAGTAELVKQYNIGFVVKNLGEIADKINAMSNDNYQLMCSNTEALAADISSGKQIVTALRGIGLSVGAI